MIRHLRVLFAAILLAMSVTAWPMAGRADDMSDAGASNPMGYRLMPADQAATLPRNQGALGLDVQRGPQITSSGMTFEVMDVTGVRGGGAGAAAGLRRGDRIVAINGLVFQTVSAFASYVRALQPGSQATIDYIPAGGTPSQARRVGVSVGGPGAPPPQQQARQGMSTGAKVAIGVAALLACYKLGCFSRGNQQPQQYPQGYGQGVTR